MLVEGWEKVLSPQYTFVAPEEQTVGAKSSKICLFGFKLKEVKLWLTFNVPQSRFKCD